MFRNKEISVKLLILLNFIVPALFLIYLGMDVINNTLKEKTLSNKMVTTNILVEKTREFDYKIIQEMSQGVEIINQKYTNDKAIEAYIELVQDTELYFDSLNPLISASKFYDKARSNEAFRRISATRNAVFARKEIARQTLTDPYMDFLKLSETLRLQLIEPHNIGEFIIQQHLLVRHAAEKLQNYTLMEALILSDITNSKVLNNSASQRLVEIRELANSQREVLQLVSDKLDKDVTSSIGGIEDLPKNSLSLDALKNALDNSSKAFMVFDNIRQEIYAYTLAKKQVPENLRNSLQNQLSKVISDLQIVEQQASIPLNNALELRVNNDREKVNVITATTIIVSSILFSLFILLFSRILIPIKGVTSAMNKLSHGDSDAMLPASTHKNEIGEMLDALIVFKQNAKELEVHKNNLEKMVKEQTIDLIEAKNKAEAANLAKTEFLANMSHELRTPMHAVLNYSEMSTKLLEKEDYKQVTTFQDNIQTSGKRLLGLLDNLLDLSKLEAGAANFDFKKNDIREVVENSIAELDALLKDKEINVVKNYKCNDFEVEFDTFKIMQVVINLVSNAIKFSPAKTTINITLEDTNCNGIPAVVFSVQDQGVGIAPNELEMIFDKFAESSKTKTNAGGTGLGLAICNEIIKGHNGKIWAESAGKEGSTFKFILPRVISNPSYTPKLQAN